MKIQLLYIFIFHLSFLLLSKSFPFAQQKTAAEMAYQHGYYYKSIQVYDSLFTQYAQQLTDCQYIELKLAYSWNYLKMYDLPAFKAILSKISFEKVTRCGEDALGMYYYSQGYYNFHLGNYNQSQRYFEKCIAQLHQSDQMHNSLIANTYYMLGYISIRNKTGQVIDSLFAKVCKHCSPEDYYLCLDGKYLSRFYSMRYEESLVFAEKSMQHTRSFFGAYSPIYAKSINNIAAAKLLLKDYDQAIVYLKQALLILEKNKLLTDYTSLIHSNLGLCYYNTHKYKQAITSFKNSLSIDYQINEKSMYESIKKYIRLAWCALKLNHLKATKTYLDQAKLLIDELDHGSNVLSAKRTYYRALADYFEAKGAIEQAILCQKEAIKYANEQKLDRFYALLLSDLALLYLKKNDHDQALIYIQMGLSEFTKTESQSTEKINPYNFYLLNAYAKILEKGYQQSPDEINLRKIQKIYKETFQVIDAIRFTYQTEGSKLEFAKMTAAFYRRVIEQNIHFYKQTGDKKYLYEAFRVSERNRSTVLSSGLQASQARKLGGLPDTLAEQEATFRKDIAKHKSTIEKLLQKDELTKAEDIELKQQKEELFYLNKSYQELLANLEKNFPKYYELKYDISNVSISTIQGHLSENQRMISYIMGKEKIYAFMISHKSFDLVEVSNSEKVASNIHQLRNFLMTTPNFAGDSAGIFKNKFIKTAHQLYQQLIVPLERNFLQNNHLIFIPDGILALIPFEVFLQSSHSSKTPYNHLSYFVRNNIISYANSATLWVRSKGKVKTLAPKDVLAFAPSFQGGDQDQTARAAAVRGGLKIEDTVRGGLMPLAWSTKELEFIGEYFSIDQFINEQATENRFKELASEYKILHIATHANVQEERPLYSAIYFTETLDSLEDASLHTFELYNLELNAELAVLSACNTGYGEVIQGEGVHNLARGFTYAGCPSIVMSLWNASDYSSAEQMNYFYQELAKGVDKATALRSVKLKFLEKDDPILSHPYFWSQFVASGDMRPVVEKEVRWFLVVVIFIILLLAFTWKMRRKLGEKPQMF